MRTEGLGLYAVRAAHPTGGAGFVGCATRTEGFGLYAVRAAHPTGRRVS